LRMVFVGCTGVPGSHCGTPQPFSTISSTPVIAEKPYITIDSSGKFYLEIPRVEFNKVGPTSNYGNVDEVGFDSVFVAKETDTAATINSKLASGLHVVLSPGNYKLDDSITINRANAVVLGIGFPTLIVQTGKPAIVVGNVDGVRVGGILLQAGQQNTSSLLQWGTGSYAGNANNPGFIYDVFARVGGTNDPSQYQVQVDVMVQINSAHVVYDNSWLWRADHGVNGNVYNENNPNYHGLVVNGANVTMYGLAVEHQIRDLVLWNGEYGATYFFQSELPYDCTQQNFGSPAYAGYRVASTVQNHIAYGAGVYCYFRDNAVTTPSGIATGSSPNVKFTNSVSIFLNGMGQITHTINNFGNPVSTPASTSYVCSN